MVRYYNSHHWKVTTGLQPVHAHPDNIRDGYRVYKHYEYRSRMRGPYGYIRGASYGLRYPQDVFRSSYRREREASEAVA